MACAVLFFAPMQNCIPVGQGSALAILDGPGDPASTL